MPNKDEIDAIANLASQVVKPVYDDGVKPGMQEVGQAVQTVTGLVNVFLAPLAILVHGVKAVETKLKDGISQRLSNTPSDQIVPPPLNIVGPLLEKYKYNHDTAEISDLFLNLLANSMDAHRVAESHPAFVGLIAQLSPDEARLFRNITANATCPKIDIGIETVGDRGYNLIRKNILSESFLKKIENTQFVPTYLDNLQRLGLVTYTNGANQDHYTDEGLYAGLISNPLIKSLESSLNPELQKVKVMKGYIAVTDFGRTFSSAVNR